jgi:hypothetical protein
MLALFSWRIPIRPWCILATLSPRLARFDTLHALRRILTPCAPSEYATDQEIPDSDAHLARRLLVYGLEGVIRQWLKAMDSSESR